MSDHDERMQWPADERREIALVSQRVEQMSSDMAALRDEFHAFRKEIEAKTDGRLAKVLAGIFSVATILLLPWLIWLQTSALDHDRRIGTIEANRMPATAIRTELDSVRRELADAPLLRDLRDAMAKLQASQDLVRADVGQVKERIVRVETKLDGGR